MERTTFCLLFYIRRTKLNRNGEAPIMMRITVNGVRVDASVKKTILPEFWSAAKERFWKRSVKPFLRKVLQSASSDFMLWETAHVR